ASRLLLPHHQAPGVVETSQPNQAQRLAGHRPFLHPDALQPLAVRSRLLERRQRSLVGAQVGEVGALAELALSQAKWMVVVGDLLLQGSPRLAVAAEAEQAER